MLLRDAVACMRTSNGRGAAASFSAVDCNVDADGHAAVACVAASVVFVFASVSQLLVCICVRLCPSTARVFVMFVYMPLCVRAFALHSKARHF